MTLQGLILICAMTGPCDRHTATDVIIVPGVQSEVPTQCLQQAQAYLAQAQGVDISNAVVLVTCGRDTRRARR